MSYPILYSPTETNFSHNGKGILSSCVSFQVTEEANGLFELSMQYPMDGIHYEDIADRAILKAKVDQFRDAQLFRIYSISKTMAGIVTVSAQHISYDLSGMPVSPFSATNISDALLGLSRNSVVNCPFDFWTDKQAEAEFVVSVPSSIRSVLGGSRGSVLDVYGGEYEFDNYTVKLHHHRGENKGVSIRYGKNLTNIRQDRNCSLVATSIYPYWVDSEGGSLVEIPEKLVNSPGTYNFVRIVPVDFSEYFDTKPTTDQLKEAAETYVKENNVGVPDVSLTVSFAQLSKSEEYKHLGLLERVGLFDEVNVEFPALGVSATAKVVKIVYDCLLDRIENVTLGSVRSNIADTIVKQQKEIEKTPTKNDLKKVKKSATAWLTNGKGYKVERTDDFGNALDTLYMDRPDIETAQDVLRIGQSGIGFSHDGVNGTYTSAWTIDGNFVADFITTGKLYSSDGKTYFDLDNDEIVTSDETGTVKISNGNITTFDKDGSQQITLRQRYINSPDGLYSVGAELAFFGKSGNRIARFAISGDHFIMDLPDDEGTMIPFAPKWKSYTIGEDTINYIGI